MDDNSIWEKEEIIKEIDKNDRGEKIRVKKCEKRGKKFVDVRTYYIKNDVLTPGKGIAIPDDLADEVADAIKSRA
jgi:hypothetical protein